MELSCENCVNEKVIHKGKYDIFLECQDCLKGCVKQIDSCCVSPEIISINMPRIDKKPTKRNFCKRCGHVSGLVKMSNPDEWKKLPLVTREQANEIADERYKKRRAFYAYIQNKRSEYFESKKEEHTKKYHEYLKSPEWKDRRLRVLNRDKYICQACLINEATQVHHLTYDRIFKEPLFDLTGVCDSCHNSIHNIEIEIFKGSSEDQIKNYEINKLLKVFGL